MASVKTHPDFPDKNYYIVEDLHKKYVTLTANDLSSLNSGLTDIDYSY